jgi:hypothetical protein
MTRDLFRKKSDLLRTLLLGVALAAGGGILLSFVGNVGVLFLLVGLALVAVGIVRGRKPLVTVEATRVLLNFAAPLTIPFHTIASVDLLKTQDISLALANGNKVVIPLSKLEEDDGAWLKKQLRKEVRLANANN